jgi:hypothetical protein
MSLSLKVRLDLCVSKILCHNASRRINFYMDTQIGQLDQLYLLQLEEVLFALVGLRNGYTVGTVYRQGKMSKQGVVCKDTSAFYLPT